MLLTKTVKMNWHSTNREWYKSKGYIYTKYGGEFEVKVEDLPNGSNVYIDVRCNECGKLLEPMTWQNYLKYVKEDGKYYCKSCCNKLFDSKIKIKRTKLLNSKSLGYWLIKNLSLRKAIEIILRWDDEKNGCSIKDVSFSSHGLNEELKGYYFKCLRGIHPSELKNVHSFINAFNKYNNSNQLECSACNSFAQYGYDNIDNDFLSKYWDWERNEELGIDPWKISFSSGKKVWLKCIKLSYYGSYYVVCSSFSTGGCRCPLCCNFHGQVHKYDSLGWLYPEVFNIWSEKNKKSPYDYSPNSSNFVYWKCFDNKHKDYKRSIINANKLNFRCPECVNEMDESILQNKTRLYLESLKYGVLHEHYCTLVPINPKTKHPLPFDNEIILTNGIYLICEVNGIQHYEELPENNPWLNGKKPKEYLHKIQLHDRYKRFIAHINGYEYLELPYWAFDKQDTYKKLIDDKINGILHKSNTKAS